MIFYPVPSQSNWTLDSPSRKTFLNVLSATMLSHIPLTLGVRLQAQHGLDIRRPEFYPVTFCRSLSCEGQLLKCLMEDPHHGGRTRARGGYSRDLAPGGGGGGAVSPFAAAAIMNRRSLPCWLQS